ncbi:MAG TPA: glycoside hydrolase family 15 protein [Silvibacterium sp.]|nr:glycoside hydrolase family 15 protein [Silvibacterium sp.]
MTAGGRSPLLIEDYALIGDCETAALVGRNGSIDWLCLPNFASAACFAKLLGTEENGFWSLGPAEKILKTSRRYEPHTLILETTHETRSGAVRVRDFMPLRERHPRLVRIVEGLQGKVAMCGELALRFDYGKTVPWVTRTTDGMKAVAGPDSVWLHTRVPVEGKGLRTVSEFTVRKGETVSFVLTYGRYGDFREQSVGEPIDVQKACRDTRDFWIQWTGKGTFQGQHREMVERSLITLKALTYAPTGGIIAAPTTSLPEAIGGVRNWDYRYCWLRDATFTLLALMNGGYHEEAKDWMHWLRRTVAGSPDQVQIMYGITGERALVEWQIGELPGYENSRPVRIGNAASGQLQLDTYGELLDTFFWTYRLLGRETQSAEFGLLRRIVEHLETIWELPDEGIWEVRGGAKQFTYSKVMAWVAFDRAIRIAESCGFKAPLKRWKETRETIHRQVCDKGFNKRLNSFVQYYGSRHLDASALLIAMVGFLPAEDPRIHGTVAAIDKYLMQDGLVMRYDTSKSDDGLPGSEGKFLACSFWMVNNLKLIGRHTDAEQLFERLLLLANDVGLLAEEYDTRHKRQMGNFPQAFSHIALVGAAHSLSLVGSRRHTAGAANHNLDG